MDGELRLHSLGSYNENGKMGRVVVQCIPNVLDHIHIARDVVPFKTMLAYFCFPTLGVAVPMKPGDFLLFNSTIPHCISSQCHADEKIMCIAMFLKTVVLGLNNHAIPLTEEQIEL